MHCSCENCNKPVLAKGFCSKHYYQMKRHGQIFEETRLDFNRIVSKGIYYELILTNSNMEEVGRAKIDKEDLGKIQAIGRWTLNKSNGYVYNRNTMQYMHRVIMNVKEGEEVDHKKTGIKNISDNRKKNLRICTKSQNQYNQGLAKNNTSGFKGVSYMKNKNKWRAEISINNKNKYLGLFATAKEAAKAYKEAAKVLHKDFLHKSLKGESI